MAADQGARHDRVRIVGHPLTYVANARFNREIIGALTDLAKRNKPYVKAGAIAGISGIQKAVYIALTRLTGRSMPAFDTVEAARDWLVTQ